MSCNAPPKEEACVTSHKTAGKETNFQLALKSQHLHLSIRKLAVFTGQNNMGGDTKKALSNTWIPLYVALVKFVLSSGYFFLLVFIIIYIGVLGNG